MATDPLNLMVLIGMGLREFSMSAPYIPKTKAFLQGIPLALTEEAWQKIQELATSGEIRECLMQLLEHIEIGH
jgi:phosphotransferase system enzyme I (PtsP)